MTIAGAFLLISNNDKEKISYNKKISFNASYMIPTNLQEVEERSTIIVKGKFTGERKTDQDEDVIGPSSISQFKINKTYKGKSTENIISVIEPFEIEKNDFTNIEGYVPMQENKEYILFLREIDIDGSKEYAIISISFGKYNLSGKEVSPIETQINYLDEVLENDFVSKSSEECNIYNGIKKDVLNKYK
jgi:hypothetical protein